MLKSLLIGLLITIFSALTLSSSQAQTIPSVPVANQFGVRDLLPAHLQKESLLVLGFYKCKHVCQFVVKNLTQTLSKFKEYPNAVFLSIDEEEGPRDAIQLMKRINGPERQYWTFLVADKASIDRIAKDLNFEMKRDPATGQITHEIGFYTVKNGEVFRKISHLEITEADFAFDKPRPTVVDHIKKFCSAFNPANSKYGPLVMRALFLTCCAFLIASLTWFYYLRRKTP